VNKTHRVEWGVRFDSGVTNMADPESLLLSSPDPRYADDEYAARYVAKNVAGAELVHRSVQVTTTEWEAPVS
jgi:hypothetical protein